MDRTFLRYFLFLRKIIKDILHSFLIIQFYISIYATRMNQFRIKFCFHQSDKKRLFIIFIFYRDTEFGKNRFLRKRRFIFIINLGRIFKQEIDILFSSANNKFNINVHSGIADGFAVAAGREHVGSCLAARHGGRRQ